MNCQYCGKAVYGMTGLQELQKYNKHLNRCKKRLKVDSSHVDMRRAMDLRCEAEHLYEEGQN